MKLQLTALLIFLTLSLKAQSPDIVNAKIFYKLTHAYDTTNAQKVNEEDFYLQLGKNSWAYKSYTHYLMDSTVRAGLKQTGHIIPPIGLKRGSSEEIYVLLSQNTLYFRPNTQVGKYLLSQDLPDFKWKLSQEKKKIAGYTCQKASGTYYGRNYTAWFTPELPYKAGPWKLQGLPGLILEAYDSTGRIKFEFTGFVPVKNGETLEPAEKNNTPIAWKDFKKIVESYENDPEGFTNRRFGGTITASAPPPKNVKYNGHINFPFAVNEVYK